MDSGNLGGLENILQNMQITSRSLFGPERRSTVFNKVKDIYAFIMMKLKQEELQTLYTDLNIFIEQPSSYYVEMDVPIKLNYPDVHATRSNNGLIYLKSCCVVESQCPFVSSDGYIRCDSVKNYVNMKLQGVLAHIPSSWNLQIIHGMNGHNYTIVTKAEMVSIYMNIIPAFEFPVSQWPLAGPPVPASVSSKFPWFAMPWHNPVNNDDKAFTVYAPFWLTEMLKEMPNSLVFLNFMMSWHARRAEDLPNFSGYMLKSFMLKYALSYGMWDLRIDQLVSVMPSLLAQINSGRLDSVLVDGQNMLEFMTAGEVQQCMATFQDLYNESPYDKHEFWINLLERIPDVANWFSKYVTLYSNCKYIMAGLHR